MRDYLITNGIVSVCISFMKNGKKKKTPRLILENLTNNNPLMPNIFSNLSKAKNDILEAPILYAIYEPDEYSESEEEYITPTKPKKKKRRGLRRKTKMIKGDISNQRPGIDPIFLFTRIQLRRLEANDIVLMTDEQLYNYFPLIVAMIRDMTGSINLYKNRPVNKYLTKVWNELASALVDRIHIDSYLGNLISWMEEKNLGLSMKMYRRYDMLTWRRIEIFHVSNILTDSKQFWNMLGDNIFDYFEGERITDINIMDPFEPNCRILTIEIVKSYSKYKGGILIESVGVNNKEETIHSKFWFCRGGDKRKDLLIMQMFNLFNDIWRHSSLNTEDIPYAFTYNIIPLCTKYSIQEYINDSETMSYYRWDTLASLNTTNLNKFMRSSVGAFVSCWILGIRDRTQDNMHIKERNTFINDNIGYIFNSKNNIHDAPRFAINPLMRAELVKMGEWAKFKRLCAESFLILRDQSSLIINTCDYLFTPIYGKDMKEVRSFLFSSFMLDRSPTAAYSDIKAKCEKGAKSLLQKIKIRRTRMVQKFANSDDYTQDFDDGHNKKRRNTSRLFGSRKKKKYLTDGTSTIDSEDEITIREHPDDARSEDSGQSLDVIHEDSSLDSERTNSANSRWNRHKKPRKSSRKRSKSPF
eukprot:TRINITY_DN6240_c0_g1_i1.p1 TRINITY_DN6240_c0_g1~~TRINITY_DN6240_c0_g1_i1.p1  ORF type:complete len:640 (+),score=114.31 TRINITY_DN6240_c0_g1_i1:92-2011(+)